MNPQIHCPAPTRRTGLESESHVNVLKKLQHPVALVVQGFVVGGVLFWTTQGQAMQAPVAGPAPIVTSISAD